MVSISLYTSAVAVKNPVFKIPGWVQLFSIILKISRYNWTWKGISRTRFGV